MISLSLIGIVTTGTALSVPKKPTFKDIDEETEYEMKKYCGHLEVGSNQFYDCLNEFDKKIGLKIYESWKNKKS